MKGGLQTQQPPSSDLPERAHAFLDSMRSPQIEPLLTAWPKSSPRRQVSPAALPVLRWMGQLDNTDASPMGELVREVQRQAGRLAWRQSYATSQISASFLDNYGWAEVVGLVGELGCENLACGFLLLGPHTFYPPHRHEAEEVYIPLSGAASWQMGTQGWVERPPGSIIQHARHVPHAMRTTSSALLALYLWRTDRLDQKAELGAS